LNKKSEEKTITVFHNEFREDISYWVKIDRKIALKILE